MAPGEPDDLDLTETRGSLDSEIHEAPELRVPPRLRGPLTETGTLTGLGSESAGAPPPFSSGGPGTAGPVSDPWTSTGAERADAERQAPAEWKPGDVILDLYEVIGVLGRGGMGTVYRVHHRGWGLDLAVKTPSPKIFRKPHAIESFERECETWIRLGSHPHVVPCHYVRRLGEVPRIFVEYVEGGTLRDWIHDGRLYAGGQAAALERILDVAIQLAWGLAYAHDRGLIHQDVKPANLMLSSTGVAKLTDFGLARARVLAGEEVTTVVDDPGRDDDTLLASTGGGTPAYWSPEQAAGLKQAGVHVTRRADVYSWAVSVFEAFNGDVTWSDGRVAGAALRGFLQSGETAPGGGPRLPADLGDLLLACLERDADARPAGFDEIEASLRELHHRHVGRPYERVRPDGGAEGEVEANLNNRAVSLLDLGKLDEARGLLDRVLADHPEHPQATYNRQLIALRTGEASQEACLRACQEVCRARPDEWISHYLCGLMELEQWNLQDAVHSLHRARSQGGGEEVTAALNDTFGLQGRSPHVVRDLTGHRADVVAVALTPDGSVAASAGRIKHADEPQVRVWDPTTGAASWELQAHTGGVNDVDLDAAGRRLLTAGDEGLVKLWDLPGRCHLRSFRGHEGRVYGVTFCADGRRVVSGSGDGRMIIWDADTALALRILAHRGNAVRALAVTPDGTIGLAGHEDGSVDVWSLMDGRHLGVLVGHGLPVRSLAVSTDGRWALSGSEDETVRTWDLATGQPVWTAEIPRQRVRCVALSPDHRWALAGSEDWTVRMWEATTGQLVWEAREHDGDVNALALARQSGWLLSAGSAVTSTDRSLRLWELSPFGGEDARRPAPTVLCQVTSVEEAARARERFRTELDASRVALERGATREAIEHLRAARQVPGHELRAESLDRWSELGRRARRTDLRGSWCRYVLKDHMAEVAAVAFDPHGALAVSGGLDEMLCFWDVHEGKLLRTELAHRGGVRSVRFSPTGGAVISGGVDGGVKMWNRDGSRCTLELTPSVDATQLAALPQEGRAAHLVWLSHDERWLHRGTWTGLDVFDLQQGRRVRKVRAPGFHYPAASVSADGGTLLLSERPAIANPETQLREPEQSLKLFDIASERSFRTLGVAGEQVAAVTLSPDFRWAAAATGRGVLLWETSQEGAGPRPLSSAHASALAFSADGRWLLVGCEDGSVGLWEPDARRCLRSFEAHTAPVRSVALSPDGRWAMSGSEDRTMRLWELDWELEVPEADWDDAARSHLDAFLTCQTPFAALEPGAADQRPSLLRDGVPSWTDEDLERLLRELADAGLGWIAPGRIREELRRATGGPPAAAPGPVMAGIVIEDDDWQGDGEDLIG